MGTSVLRCQAKGIKREIEKYKLVNLCARCAQFSCRDGSIFKYVSIICIQQYENRLSSKKLNALKSLLTHTILKDNAIKFSVCVGEFQLSLKTLIV